MEFDPMAFFGFEVLGGWLGGVGGGIGGFFLGFFLCLSSLGDAPGLAGLGCLVGGGGLGYLIGTPVGSTLGVSIVGALNGVEGNLLLGFVGGMAGEGAGILTVATLAGIGFDSDLGGFAYLGAIPLVSAVGAALGYNADAIVKSSGEPVAP